MARTLSDAVAAFRAAGVEVCHQRFRSQQRTPYAVAHLVSTDNGHADDKTSRVLGDYNFYLRVDERDLGLEKVIQQGLDDAHITWSKEGGMAVDSEPITFTYSFKVYED